jgi:hypothetical protein
VSLALGIGANTAAFSLVYAVLFRPLPVEDPASLALVSAGSTSFQSSMSYPAYRYLRDHASTIEGLIAFRAHPLNVSAGGVGIGLMIAVWMRGLLLQVVPGRQELEVAFDFRVFGASIVAGLFTTAVLASVTARHNMRVGVLGTGIDLTARLWLRKGLVVAQLALSVLVLVAASLFTRTLASLGGVDPGFDQEHVLIASTATDGYTSEQRDTFDARLLQEVRALRASSPAPWRMTNRFACGPGWTVSARPGAAGPSPQVDVSVAFVSPDYFKTMDMPILRGREFIERDRSRRVDTGGRQRALCETPCRPKPNPSARRWWETAAWCSDHQGRRQQRVDRTQGSRSIHALYARRPRRAARAVRGATGDADRIVRAAVQHLDPQVPVFEVRTRSIRGLFFGIGINDWQSLALSLAVLAAVAAAAAWIPARRASRVDPLIALRSRVEARAVGVRPTNLSDTMQALATPSKEPGSVRMRPQPIIDAFLVALVVAGGCRTTAPSIRFAPEGTELARLRSDYPLADAERRALTPESLHSLTQEQVDQIYQRLSSGPMPDGPFRGDLVFPRDRDGGARIRDFADPTIPLVADIAAMRLEHLGRALWKAGVLPVARRAAEPRRRLADSPTVIVTDADTVPKLTFDGETIVAAVPGAFVMRVGPPRSVGGRFSSIARRRRTSRATGRFRSTGRARPDSPSSTKPGSSGPACISGARISVIALP